MIEKAPGGFIVRGYDNTNPTFNYNEPQVTISDPNINVGGISESFLEWSTGQKYLVGSNVRNNSQFYRVKAEHTSTTSFEADKFQPMAELPTLGGRTAVYRKSFETDVKVLPYGTLLESIQDVVDFILGYGNYLESVGFKFDYYNKILCILLHHQ